MGVRVPLVELTGLVMGRLQSRGCGPGQPFENKLVLKRCFDIFSYLECLIPYELVSCGDRGVLGRRFAPFARPARA